MSTAGSSSERVTVRHFSAPPLDSTMRTRFAPAPSGDLHVGNIRTALYSWSLARRHGGTFLLRVEDTYRSRVSDEAVAAALDVLCWMGFDGREGTGIGEHIPPRR